MLNEINPCLLEITANLYQNATSGELEGRFGEKYIDKPTHGEKLEDGGIDWSNVELAIDHPMKFYLAEIYQAMGVRHDIESSGPLDNSINDEISDDGAHLNKF